MLMEKKPTKFEQYSILFLVISLLFSGSNVYALVYPILKLLVFVSFLCFFFIVKIDINFFNRPLTTNIYILLLFVWIFFSLLSSIIYINEDTLSLALRYVAYIFVFFFLTSLKSNLSYVFFKYYSSVFLIVVFISFVSYVLSFVKGFPLTELVVGGGRQYFTTFFNVLIPDAKTNFGGVTFYRFQSIFDEPGTFSFLLLPAMYWYIFIQKNYIKIFFLSICLIFSLSAGALFQIFISYIIYLFIINPTRAVPMLILIALFSVLLIVNFPSLSNFLEYKLGIGAYEGSHSSMGVRMLEIKYVIDSLSGNFFGLGFSSSNIKSTYNSNISVGFFRLIIYSGMIGGIAIIVLFSHLSLYSILCLTKKDNPNFFVGFSLLSLFFMSMQRSTFIDGFMFITLFSFLLTFNNRGIKYGKG